uniref:DED domain-containing protein n=1 Tax=Branchiostoma floridae TaxID=7739 RepID=C3ZC90_BRAFL|eukprot:XP_002593851.1 hypothetical protein BRAFLDRAFT_75688 [Branchiostoma floridae]
MEEQVEKPKVDNKAESSETTKEQQRAESNRQLEELKDQDVKEPPQPPSSPPLASSLTTMASAQSDSELSPRNKLYLKISESLSEDQVKSLRTMLITDHNIGKGKIETSTPHEIFNMLEDEHKIGEGNLGLLIELLNALGETQWAKELEEEENKQSEDMEKTQEEAQQKTDEEHKEQMEKERKEREDAELTRMMLDIQQKQDELDRDVLAMLRKARPPN